jgi:acyl-CoA thioesterase YciA
MGNEAKGELVIQTIAMPADTNANGDIFGGWLLSQMDLGGAVLAYQIAKNRIATRAIDDMVFIKPVKVGDRVACYAKVVHQGRTSIGIALEAWAFRLRACQSELVAKGIYTYVSIDEAGRATPIHW